MILIVDDKPENLLSLKSILELNRLEVDTASSGEEALQKILKHPYVLIILDVQMPGMDGFEVAEAISGYSKTKDIPIIFLSAVNTDKKFITRGYESGGIDYVTKPVDPDILLLKVKTFCRLYEQSNELNQIHKALREEISVRQKVEEALNSANDELERRVAERTLKLQMANEELEIRNHELQQFTSVASHDLKEPLRKIQVFSSIVKDKLLEDKTGGVLDYVERIINSSERMSGLINDLLAYSRLSVQSLFELTDLNKIIDDILSDLEIPITEKNANIKVAKLPSVDSIPGQIRQLFQNILSNALKFSQPGMPPHIDITSDFVNEKDTNARAVPWGPYCRIYIQDNGIGFDEQYLEKIFTLFQRLNAKEAYEGTGIGLAIAKKIIDRHNGLITARSKETEGATFIIILPLEQDILLSANN